jgi:hypothetical protein
MVPAARCNAQYDLKTTRLKTFGSYLVASCKGIQARSVVFERAGLIVLRVLRPTVHCVLTVTAVRDDSNSTVHADSGSTVRVGSNYYAC